MVLRFLLRMGMGLVLVVGLGLGLVMDRVNLGALHCVHRWIGRYHEAGGRFVFEDCYEILWVMHGRVCVWRARCVGWRLDGLLDPIPEFFALQSGPFLVCLEF
ncbi:hypothetical protein F4777DRAFT_96142 [Nemania sp. FL0916]|nr:hypothetical protein F4777DRAFT_96142 [Nemania sp. FL0916]